MVDSPVTLTGNGGAPITAVAPKSIWRGDDNAPLAQLVKNELERRWARGSQLLDSICDYALVPTGKLLRPVLLLESALAVGGDLRCVLPAAVGAECGHVASLIHDDIIDADDLRRGRASVPYKYGVSDAIVAGDALIFDLFASLAECGRIGAPDSRVVSALDAVARAGIDLCRGQSLEAELCNAVAFDADTYLTVARLKTGSLFKGACECGAILGGGLSGPVAALASYGERLGIAFQIQDDLLPYLSNTQVMGKSETSDIVNGRLTLPVILAYQACAPDDRQLVKDALRSDSDPAVALEFLQDVLTRTGAIAEAAQMARDCVASAHQSLAQLPASASRDRLANFADLVVQRNH
ncbi:MAG: polyprenyl synthetase family protein [Micromonosporaceae bacterium]